MRTINPITGKPFKSPNLSDFICNECGIDFKAESYRLGRIKYCGFICKQKAAGKAAGVKNITMLRGTGTKTYVKFYGRHEHRVVAEQMIGRPLVKGEIVHHIDGNKKNNAPENLQVMTQSEHIKLHLPEMIRIHKEKAGRK